MKWIIIVVILLVLCGVSSALAYYFHNRYTYELEDTETQEARRVTVMTDREKVMRGLMHHSGEEIPIPCDNCPYEDEPYCSQRLAADALALLREYDTALKLMVFQYCNVDGGFYHRFMSAGEEAFRVLGIENGQSTNGVWEKWFQTNERGEDNA